MPNPDSQQKFGPRYSLELRDDPADFVEKVGFEEAQTCTCSIQADTGDVYNLWYKYMYITTTYTALLNIQICYALTAASFTISPYHWGECCPTPSISIGEV